MQIPRRLSRSRSNPCFARALATSTVADSKSLHSPPFRLLFGYKGDDHGGFVLRSRTHAVFAKADFMSRFSFPGCGSGTSGTRLSQSNFVTRIGAAIVFGVALAGGVGTQCVAQDDAGVSQDGGEEAAFEFSAEQLALMERYAAIEWQEGPATGKIGDIAEIKIPEGYSFTGAKGAQDLLELYGNPRNPNMLGALIPDAEDEDWTLVFQFSDIGYVDDSDRDNLDADGIMSDFQSGIPAGNEQRRAMGMEEMTSMSWQERPFYNSETNNLTWALKLDFPSGSSINYDIRMLGRRGVMEATLVGDPETYASVVPVVNQLLADYQFTSGNKYAEWKQGDKVAAYGLAGLVGGGALVAASKTGLLAKLGLLLAKGGKAIILGVLVFFGAIGSFLKKLFGGGDSETAR